MSDLPKYTGPRFKLELGRYPVLRVIKREFGVQEFSISLGGVTIVITAPKDADVHEGDLLSLYTEVAFAIPSTTPKQ